MFIVIIERVDYIDNEFAAIFDLLLLDWLDDRLKFRSEQIVEYLEFC